MTMNNMLTLRYSGPDVDAGRMDAYAAAANIIAFADFLGAAAKATYGEKAKLRTEVTAFREGSFAVQFALDCSGLLATLFSSVNVKDLLDVVRQAVELWKFLNGAEPKSIIRQADNSVQIENNSGQVTYYRAETLVLVTDVDGAAAAARFIREPLRGNLDVVAIEHDSELVVQATKADAPNIGLVVAQETLTENMVHMWVVLESPVFKKDNKWRFSDGQNSFHATVEDATFLGRVARRDVLFGQDDSLLVEMRIRQSGNFGTLKVDRAITRVLDHKHAPRQDTL